MSVSRDFIDSYSPEVPNGTRDETGLPNGAPPVFQLCGVHDGLTKLAFRFQTPEDLLESLVTVAEAGHFVLRLAQKRLQRLMQPDRLVDLGTGTCPVSAKPDQFLHVGIGRHDLPA